MARIVCGTFGAAALLLCSTSAWAQAVVSEPASEEPAAQEDVVVTGTLIRGLEIPRSSPVSVITAETLARSGASTPADLARTLPVNTGSQFNSDIQAQGGAVGTAQFNLRGLGLNSTLTLLNGRRQTEYGIANADNDTFVDVNSLVPLIAVERVEILKDGATALYGSDAVAGVVNFVTRRRFNGVDARAAYYVTGEGDQRDLDLQLAAGMNRDRFRLFAAVQYFDRTELDAGERPEVTAGSNISTLGQPGSFQRVFYPIGAGGRPNLNAPAQAGGPPIADPLCGAPGVGGIRGAGVGPDGGCGYDNSFENSLVPDQERVVAYGSAEFEVTDAVTLNLEGTYAWSHDMVETSTSFPIVQFPLVGANNPGNTFRYLTPFGPPGSGQFIGDPAVTRFYGRAFGTNEPPQIYENRHELFRIAGGLDVDLGGDWRFDVDGAYSRSEVNNFTPDLRTDQFQLALNCQAGPNRNLCFNPFGNAALAQPGDPRFNTPEVIAAIRSGRQSNSVRDLVTAQGVVSGTMFELPGGPAGVALGGQYRRDTYDARYNADTTNNNLLFLYGEPSTRGVQDVWAAFGEVRLPVLETLDVQLAARYEKYDSFSSFDPKVGVAWRPIEAVLLRGSYGTAFRAPSVVQRVGTRTAVLSLDDPLTNTTRIFRPVRTIAEPDLDPEQAETISFGGELKPVDAVTLTVDYWRFDYSDRIVRRNPQAVINANPRDLRIIRSAATGDIQRIDVEFFNAASLLAEGIDASATLKVGDFAFRADATWLMTYDIRETESGPKIDGVGSRNFLNIGVSAPEWRATGALDWASGPYSASARVNYIDSYRDDRAGGGRIDDQTTVDLQAAAEIGAAGDRKLQLTAGVLNLFDKLPPRAASEIGYDPTVHDPRGRIFYVKAGVGF